VLLLATLAGCTVLPKQEQPAATPPDPDALAYRALRDWLEKEQTVAAMESGEVVAQLVKTGKPGGPEELFYFGLLNQKLKTYASWTQARDAFRDISRNPTLTSEQRQLATILMLYNQSRINWYLEYREVQADFAALQGELDAAQQENGLLQQKIQAITDLETSISTRREQ
jgi:alkylhydroperoxidase/carboxymuconolactone decarboxylase family protein YurZ